MKAGVHRGVAPGTPLASMESTGAYFEAAGPYMPLTNARFILLVEECCKYVYG